MGIVIIVIVALIVLAALTYILTRNSMIASRNRVDEAWSGIDVQLKRRHDLVPNLVETVKGYASHEREVFEKATKARAEAMSARGVGETAEGSRS
jgi:LemA protein